MPAGPNGTNQVRARSGCQSCRVRHLKCDDGKPSCARCAKSGIECIRGYNIRFRHGANPSVDLKGGPQCEYDFSTDQTWLSTAPTLSFVDETQELASIYEIQGGDAGSHSRPGAQRPSPSSSDTSALQPSHALRSSRELGKSVQPLSRSSTEPSSQTAVTSPSLSKRRKLSADPQQPRPNSSDSPFASASAYLPSPSSLRLDFSAFSPSLHLASPNLPPQSSTPVDQFDISTPVDFADISTVAARIHTDESIWPLSDYEEARLVRNYTQYIAPDFDLCDPMRHFELVIPARAATCPILHNAILAASARRLSRIGDLDPFVSNSYHQECLKHLIPLLSDEAAILDENILAAGVILRYIEEIETPVSASDTDPDNSEGNHMFGTHIFMAAQEQLTLTGGLCYAAYFVALRQEIHCAFAHQRTIAPALTHSNIDRSLGPADPATWANRIVVHNAEVLRYCFDAHADRSVARFELLNDYTTAWLAAKPLSMGPVYVRPAQPPERIFHETWLASPLAVCAIQQYHLCRILLAAHDPRVPRLGPARRAALAAVDETLRETVLDQCAVALGNQTVQPTFVYACLGIGMCGERFSDRPTQEAMLALLERTERSFAWPTGQARKALRVAWGW